MSTKTLQLTENLRTYLLSISLHEPEILFRLRQETAKLPGADMQIAPEQGQFMSFLVRILVAKKVLEIGVFTGYSSLAVAMALPADGKIIACDVSEEYTAIARRYWTEGGVAHKIDLRIAPALETLNRLLNDGRSGSFDFAFIDADKKNYDHYYEKVLKLLRPGGVVIIDNVLWSGKVIDETKQDEDTEAIRAFNKRVYSDHRVFVTVLPLADGITLAMKK